MSAHNDPNAARDGDYSFKMPQKIPADLLAIAAGDLVFRPISERSGVWAEPAMVEKAQAEFEDTEKMIETAESLYGPYRWGRYDILVLPPSFPYGGMENPRLTFATPTETAFRCDAETLERFSSTIGAAERSVHAISRMHESKVDGCLITSLEPG